MKTVVINQFSEGMALDKYQNGTGLASTIQNYDIFRSPNRLFPMRAMVADTDGQSGIGNLLIGSDGLIYGLGIDPANPNFQEIYSKATPSTDWDDLANSLSGKTVNYSLFSEYKNYFYTADANRYIMRFDRTGVASSDTTYFDLTSFTTISNGIIHPKDDIWYVGVDNKVYYKNGHAGTITLGLTLPSTLKVTSLAWYGDYLAIACSNNTNPGVGNAALRSTVYLWNRDTSLSTVSESIDWGTGELLVLNNLDGVLVGYTHTGGTPTFVLDKDSLQIKVWEGGLFPRLVKEFFTIKETTTAPSVVINPRVDFVYDGKHYFSANIKGGSTSPELFGLWSLSKSKVTGQHTVTIERIIGSTTGVLAAAMVGDFLVTVDSAVGTTKTSSDSTSLTTAFSTNSVYESVVNPQMELQDRIKKKQLVAVGIHHEKLIANRSVTVEYRVDGGSWTTVMTSDTDDTVSQETGVIATGDQFTSGYEYEFRITSINGTVIHGLHYIYETLDTNKA